MRLTKEEQAILASVEKREWGRISDFHAESGRYASDARATLRKDRRVNIRIAERDLVRLQKKAVEEGLPYQTFISSVLHKYINGRLKEGVS